MKGWGRGVSASLGPGPSSDTVSSVVARFIIVSRRPTFSDRDLGTYRFTFLVPRARRSREANVTTREAPTDHVDAQGAPRDGAVGGSGGSDALGAGPVGPHPLASTRR